MKDRQENQHTRNKTVDKFLDDNALIIAPIPDFVLAAAALKSKNGETDALISIQSGQTGGAADAKAQAKETAIKDTMILVDIMKAKCKAINDLNLLGQVNYSKSDLEDLRDTVLPDVLNTLQQIATANLLLFASSGMTAPKIATAAGSKASYAAIMTAPRQAIDVRHAATEMIPTPLAAANKQVDICVNLGGQFITSNATFYNQLKAAAEIIDLGHSGGGQQPA